MANKGQRMILRFLAVVTFLLTVLATTTAQTYNQTLGTVVGWGGQVVPQVASGTIFTKIAAGNSFNLALKNDGTIVAWGDNSFGQSTVPSGLNGVIAIAAGSTHSLALKNDGSVVAWGLLPNAEGILVNATVPVGLSNVIAIGTRGSHNLALKSDGTIVAWGDNESTTPSGLSNVITIAVGGLHNLALKSDGTVVGWGINNWTVPTGLSDVVAIAAGDYHNLAVRNDGTVVAWGSNSYGERTVPTGLSGVTAIAAGYGRSIALKNDGTVIAWGRNDHGQSTVPTGLSNVIGIAASSEHSLALKSDGTIIAWGTGENGQGAMPTGLNIVVAISAGTLHSLALKNNDTVAAWGANYYASSTGVNNLIAVAAGNEHSLVLKNDGGVIAWGNNSYGKSTVPTGLNSVVAIAADSEHSLALKNTGNVVEWGAVWNGSDYVNSTVPQGLSNVIAIAAGANHSLALKSNSTVVAWGYNGYGQSTVPLGLSGVIALAAGSFHSLALKSNGIVVAWGNNGWGQSTVPPGLSNVIAIAAGHGHSLALKNDGLVVAWGLNDRGQRIVPVGLSNVIAIAAGDSHSLALVRNLVLPLPLVFHGRVANSNGVSIANATVTASGVSNFTTQVTTDAGGNYTFSPLVSGAYILTARATNHAQSARALTLTTPGTPAQNFQLVPLPSVPPLESTGRVPDLSHTISLDNGALRVFDDGLSEFMPIVVGQNVPPPDRLTIVLTHGWKSSPQVWARSMAQALRQNGVTPSMANIVAWDWQFEAEGVVPPVDKVGKQGVALGKALFGVFPGYTQPVHFMGHSLGALVNAAAANYLHGHATGQQEVSSTPWAWERTHMTLLDHAELANLAGREVLFDGLNPTALDAWNAVRTTESTTLNWMPPLPQHFVWADNYVSLVGSFERGAVNVWLQKAALEAGPSAKHSYPINWYGLTIANPTGSELGFRRSREYGMVAGLPGAAFPPSSFGTNYFQLLTDFNPLTLHPLPTVNQAVGIAADRVVQGVAGVAQVAGNVVATIQDSAQTAAQVIANGYNYVAGAAAQGAQSVMNLYNPAVLRLRLNTASSSSQNVMVLRSGGPQPQNAGGDGSSSQPMAWLPIQFPAHATVMAFDFIVEGYPADDALVCGIGTNNLFSLEAKYIPTNTMSASPLLDVSAWAGATNELFFGFLGGTSTNATLIIENIRFYSLAAPKLEIAVSGNAMVLNWPLTASGYVVETTPTLTAPTWEIVTNAPVILADRYALTNAWSDQARFFRLQAK
jgi:alpha-tubulin suppressor-like RCC1 family protein